MENKRAEGGGGGAGENKDFKKGGGKLGQGVGVLIRGRVAGTPSNPKGCSNYEVFYSSLLLITLLLSI